MTQALVVQNVDPAACLPAESIDPALRPDIELLMESIRQHGQRVPVFLAPHPEQAGKSLIVDGNGRVFCLAALGRPVQAIMLDKPVSGAELIELEFALNAVRRTMSLEEIGAKAERYIELTGATQKEAGRRLKCSDATISRAFALMHRIPAELRDDANRLGPYFVSAIAPLRSGDAMKQAIDYASTPGADGKRPNRDQFKQFVGSLRGKKPAKAKRTKRLRLLADERRFEVELKAGDSPDSLIEAFNAAAAMLRGYRKLSLDGLVAELAPNGQPTA